MITQAHYKTAATLALALTLFVGCQSKQDAAIEQAKQQATATGQAQQVITTDKNGTTTTTTVQPAAAPGQPQTVTTTTTSTSASAPVAGTTVTPASQPAVAGGQPASGPAMAPTPGGDPVIRPADVNVPAGTSLAIRINQHISVKTTSPGAPFDGEIAEAVVGDNGRVIIPRGTHVGGIVDASHRRGHFKGASILQLRLTSLTLNGTRYPLETHDLTRTKKGKGKRSAALIGGGAGLGMLIGGVATGGTGLLIGGLAGAGAGTGVAALTGNRDLDIPSESIVRFKLADSLTLAQ
ncbi:hypothetical protein [Granulicella sp. dw_53]|uniref:hypothetical protein n=1 Tax=Granulicella sp. dw_53 TaxID=2719792 RepID=UPI001BD582F3|nr:hypothetical protein [Granulicella sp. dw_53]